MRIILAILVSYVINSVIANILEIQTYRSIKPYRCNWILCSYNYFIQLQQETTHTLFANY